MSRINSIQSMSNLLSNTLNEMFEEITHVDFENFVPTIKVPLFHDLNECCSHVYDVKIVGISDGKIFAIEKERGDKVNDIDFTELPIKDKVNILMGIDKNFQ